MRKNLFVLVLTVLVAWVYFFGGNKFNDFLSKESWLKRLSSASKSLFYSKLPQEALKISVC